MIDGIGTFAQRIIECRETQGPFETVEQIQEVKGIGPVTSEGIKDPITVGESP
jgi:competence protein ComEA